MATVKFYTSADMSNPYVWYGYVTGYSSSEITLSDGINKATYSGSFTFSSYGLSGGTVTAYKQWTSGMLTYEVSGANVSAVTLSWYLDRGDAKGILDFVLSGHDIITGSSLSDVLNGGAGNDTITGGAGNDFIDGGLGNDTIAGGAGDDVIIYWAGSDKIDGGLGTDTLDLTGFGYYGNSYTLNNRGASSYTVSGTAASFTITDVLNKTSITVAGVENVTIGGETVSSGKFLMPNSSDITGADLLSNYEDKVPSIEKFLEPSYDFNSLPFAELVDLSRIGSESWAQRQSYNPDGSNSLTFTSDKGSKLVFTDSRTSSATVISESMSFTLTGPTATDTASSTYKLDKFTGGYTVKDSWTAPTSAGVTTGTYEKSANLSFVDSNGTSATTDDVSFSATDVYKETWSETALNGEFSGYSYKSTGSGGVLYKGVKLSLDAAYTSASDYVASNSNNNWSVTKDLEVTTITKYTFADTRDAAASFSLSMTGIVTQDSVAQSTKYDLKSIVVDTSDYNLKSATFVKTVTGEDTDESIFSTMNAGWDASQGGIEAAALSLADNLVPFLLEGDNIVTLKGSASAGVEFDGGAGNDTITGGAGNDFIDGGLGNDTIIIATAAHHTTDEVIIGGDGIDELRFTATAASTLMLSAQVSGIERVVIGTGTAAAAVATGTVALNVNGGNLQDAVTITGNAGSNILTGGSGADTLIGGAGNDTLIGGAGNDILTGGAGADSFVFNAAFGNTNIDMVSDFSVVDDTITLENGIFLSLITTRALGAGAFNTGTQASDADDRIIYNPTTGNLIYDADGSGSGAAVQFAKLSTGLSLTHADFFVI